MSIAVVLATGCSTVATSHAQRVELSSSPPGAEVWVEDPRSGKRSLGATPVVFEGEWVDETVDTSALWWGGIATLAAGGAAAIAGGLILKGDDGDLTLASQIPLMLGPMAAAGGIAMAVVALVADGDPCGVMAPCKGVSRTGQTLLTAKLADHADASTEIAIPGPIHQWSFALDAVAQVTPHAAARLTVAVFEIIDASKRLKEGESEQLTEYLVARYGQVPNISVVPRDQMRAALAGAKAESYKTGCFDESCQIELGKAVAAQKGLAARIIKVGEACAMTASLYDLKTESTERTASARTACDTAALLAGVDDLVAQLSH